MQENHKVVLAALALITTPEEFYVPFSRLQEETGMDRATVRRVCRHLARRGYAEYRKGLFTEDGYVAGSGYAITNSSLNAFSGEL